MRRIFAAALDVVPLTAVLCLAGTLGQTQTSRDTTELTIEACLVTPPTLERISQALKPLGWERNLHADLSDADLMNWAVVQQKRDLVFSNQTEDDWKGAWQRTQSNAAGLKRKVENENAPAKTLYFTHDDEHHALWVEIGNYDPFDSVSCSFAVRAEFASNSLAGLESQLTDDMPTIVPLKPKTYGGGEVVRTVQINLFRRQEISSFLEVEFPFFAVVETRQSIPR
ncbi:MAG: hypothetical protein AAF999_05535 [Pseudomonadota bacterium]